MLVKESGNVHTRKGNEMFLLNKKNGMRLQFDIMTLFFLFGINYQFLRGDFILALVTRNLINT